MWNFKELGLQNNSSPSSDICIKLKEGLTFDSFTILEVICKFYSNFASKLVGKLPVTGNKFGLHSAEVYYENVLYLQDSKFTFQTIESSFVLKILKKVEVNKAASMTI